MAIITRKTLSGNAKELSNKAISKATAAGNQMVIQLGQQRNMLEGAQQSQVIQTNNQIDNISKNIYRAKRAQRAESAALGYAGEIASLRDAAAVQDAAADELSNIIGQSEQLAANIAGQQSAINVAEVQASQQELMDVWAQDLVDKGIAKRDRWREFTGGLSGALSGALTALGAGALVSSGAKGLLNPEGGTLKRIASSAGVLGGATFLGNQLWKTADVINQNYGDGKDIYNEDVSKNIFGLTLAAGGAAGLGYRGAEKLLSKYSDNPFLSKLAGTRRNLYNKMPGAKVAQQAADTLGDAARAANAAKNLKDVGNTSKLKGMISKGSSLLKMNPWVAGALAVTGGILGGLKGGLDKKYKVNMADVLATDEAQQFADFDIDINAVESAVKNL